MDRLSPASRDSQEQLADSIARAVRDELPAPDSTSDIVSLVDEALRREACEVEVRLAWVRLLAIATLVGALLLAHLGVWPLPVGSHPALATGVLVLWGLGNVALLVALQSGRYDRRLRLVVPATTALALGVAVLLLLGFRPVGRLPTGLVIGAASTSMFLAILGSLRLSRSAARVSGLSALALWLLIAYLGELGPLLTAFIAAVVLATGFLGWRMTLFVRRVVTEEVARDRLGRLYSDAQEALRAREQLLAWVSHDLRNPLSTIAGSAELLEDFAHQGRGEGDPGGFLRMIRVATDQMKRLVDDLLDATRIEAGRLRIVPEPSRLEPVFRAVDQLMGMHAKDAELTLTVESVEHLPPVRMDSERILQVLSNLVGNAVKFTPAGGRITLGARRVGSKVRVSVSDTGPGIPETDRHRLFQSLWQGNPADKRGIGLGLSIAKAIIDAHEERLGVESSSGRGTEFWCTLSIAATSEEAEKGSSHKRRSDPRG